MRPDWAFMKGRHHFMRHIFGTTLSAAVLSLAMAGGAAAAPCGDGLDTSFVQITSIGGTAVTAIDATDCSGPIAGNDTGAQGTLISNLNGGLFSGFADDWSLFGKSDESASVDADATVSGDWSLTFPNAAQSVFAVSLKAAGDYTVYLFDLAGAANLFGGEYETTGILNNGGNTPGLSHLSIAVWNGERDTPPTAPVPLPAAGWLLLGGLGGLAALRRARKARA
jgi:hypothetical protein